MNYFIKLIMMNLFTIAFLNAHQVLEHHDVVECRLLDGFIIDLSRLQKEFESIKQAIMLRPQPHFPGRKNQDPWQGIPLKNALGASDPRGLEVGRSINHKMEICYPTDYLKKLPYIQSLLDQIAHELKAEVGLVRIFKIPAGKQIIPHSDGTIFDIYDGTVCRLHIPIISDPKVQFIINDKSFYLEPGKLYYTNVSLMHYVINKSSVDRIHLIIDMHANNELKEYILKSDKVSFVCI